MGCKQRTESRLQRPSIAAATDFAELAKKSVAPVVRAILGVQL